MNIQTVTIIIGAGPAGLPLGYFFEQHGCECLILERDPAPEVVIETVYLHPIIRHSERVELVSEHHIHDALESRWYRDGYVLPARAFFEARFESQRVR